LGTDEECRRLYQIEYIQSGTFRVRLVSKNQSINGVLLKPSFSTEEDAYNWALVNYKGKTKNWEIVS